jgi:hypothetical protein
MTSEAIHGYLGATVVVAQGNLDLYVGCVSFKRGCVSDHVTMEMNRELTLGWTLVGVVNLDMCCPSGSTNGTVP